MKQRLVGFASADNGTYILLYFLAKAVKKCKSFLTSQWYCRGLNATYNPDSSISRHTATDQTL